MRLGQIGFSCWGLIFAISESTQYPALIIFSFLLSTCNRNTYFQTILSVRQFQLENTVFTSGVNFRGKNFAVIFIWGNLFLRIAEKIAKIRTHKISCHKVTAYALLNFTKCIRNNFKLKVLLFSASTDSREILSIKFSRE